MVQPSSPEKNIMLGSKFSQHYALGRWTASTMYKSLLWGVLGGRPIITSIVLASLVKDWVCVEKVQNECAKARRHMK
eukprot:5494206-Amphidinium_carterae.1